MSDPRTEGFDPDLGPIVSIPEPFWVRKWATLFRSRAACFECKIAFETRALYETHWLRVHYSPPIPECPGDGCPGCAGCRAGPDSAPPEAVSP